MKRLLCGALALLLLALASGAVLEFWFFPGLKVLRPAFCFQGLLMLGWALYFSVAAVRRPFKLRYITGAQVAAAGIAILGITLAVACFTTSWWYGLTYLVVGLQYAKMARGHFLALEAVFLWPGFALASLISSFSEPLPDDDVEELLQE
jgi:hypothetical protein